MNSLEREIRKLTAPINGQYPRPWMTAIADPSRANVFIVGYNPAKVYSVSALGHERHIDALFNRNGQTCRSLYSELTNESPTRGNIEILTEKLASVGISSVLETNVVCYSTGKKEDLSAPQHAGGKSRGLTIFQMLVHEIRPKAMIVHGVGVRNEFNRVFRSEVLLPPPSKVPDVYPEANLSSGAKVFVIPSLALPGFQNWPPGNSFCNWADTYLDELVVRVAHACAASK